MPYSLEATYYRTALLLGLVPGEAVHRWADDVIERDPQPPAALVDVASIPFADLTALRHALWPLVIDPEPPIVLDALFGLIHRDLSAGRRGLADTVTVLRQMRSMLRMPRSTYDALNAVLVAHAREGAADTAITEWLQPFGRSRLDSDRRDVFCLSGGARCKSVRI